MTLIAASACWNPGAVPLAQARRAPLGRMRGQSPYRSVGRPGRIDRWIGNSLRTGAQRTFDDLKSSTRLHVALGRMIGENIVQVQLVDGMSSMVSGVSRYAASLVRLVQEAPWVVKQRVLRAADTVAKGLRKIGIDVGDIGSGPAMVGARGGIVAVAGGSSLGGPVGLLGPMAMVGSSSNGGSGSGGDQLAVWKERVESAVRRESGGVFDRSLYPDGDIEAIAAKAESLYHACGRRSVVGARNKRDEPTGEGKRHYTTETAVKEAWDWYLCEKLRIIQDKIVVARRNNDLSVLRALVDSCWEGCLQCLTEILASLASQCAREREAILERATKILKNNPEIFIPEVALNTALGLTVMDGLGAGRALLYTKYAEQVSLGGGTPLSKYVFFKSKVRNFPRNPFGRFFVAQKIGIAPRFHNSIFRWCAGQSFGNR